MDAVEISVIIPVYNVEKYLYQCLKSISMQSFRNFEVILIDDGSTDGSPRICDEYVQRDDRFKVLHTANAGVAAARNRGLELCVGQYICFIDSDDYVENTYLQFLYERIHNSEYDFVSCCANFVDEDGQFIKRNDYEKEIEVIKDNILDCYMISNLIEDAPWNKIYKREVFDKVRFVEGIIYEDSEIIIRILKHCKMILFTRKYLYNYRIRKESILDYLDSDDRNKRFNSKKMDLLKVYELIAGELQGTKWERKYYKRILQTCAQYWKWSGSLESAQTNKIRKELKHIYTMYRKFLWDRNLFSIKEHLFIVLSIQCPIVLYLKKISKR